MRCPGGASGHETDKISPSSPQNAKRAGEGAEPRRRRGGDGRPSTRPAGGTVFSVGSINYVASLPVDEHVSRITENVLRRFLS